MADRVRVYSSDRLMMLERSSTTTKDLESSAYRNAAHALIVRKVLALRRVNSSSRHPQAASITHQVIVKSSRSCISKVRTSNTTAASRLHDLEALLPVCH